MSMGGFLPIIDPATGKITGYKTDVGGADTVFPFSGSYTVIFRLTLSVHGWTDEKNYGSLVGILRPKYLMENVPSHRPVFR